MSPLRKPKTLSAEKNEGNELLIIEPATESQKPLTTEENENTEILIIMNLQNVKMLNTVNFSLNTTFRSRLKVLIDIS